MTYVPLDPDPFPWLPLDAVLAWLQKDTGDARTDIIDACRMAAAEWIEDERSDLQPDPDTEDTFPTKRVHQIKAGGLIAVQRLVDRADGKISYAELGAAAATLGADPEVRRLIGLKLVLG